MTNVKVIAKGLPDECCTGGSCPVCNGSEVDENFSHCEFCSRLIMDDTKKKIYCDGMIACEDCYDQAEDDELKKLQDKTDDIIAGYCPPEGGLYA